MNDGLPCSAACENNKAPILAVLRQYLDASVQSVLEIGSGTGQHAVHMAAALSHLQWQPSDAWEIEGVEAWRHASQLENIRPAKLLDVTQKPWPLDAPLDAIFSANTLHIMSWPSGLCLLQGAGQWLRPGGWLLIYGPFNYAGEYTADSNARFDAWLRARDAESGIRDFEVLRDEAAREGLLLVADHTMPANNRLLAFQSSRQ